MSYLDKKVNDQVKKSNRFVEVKELLKKMK